MPFTDSQIRQIEIAERTTSVISLVGSVFIISTFAMFPTFRKPINRLVMYASLGNVLCNIATLISTSGMQYGEAHPLCKFQAFMIQTFIPADSLWTFCMSLNVYLTFFKNCGAAQLRALEKYYFFFCYGTPIIPALIFLLMDVGGKMGIYGPATLWCWVSIKWDWMRIAFFYGPVWIIIGLTTTIYLITGKAIFKHRAALRAFSRNPTMPLPLIENPFVAGNLSAVTKVTEIQVTTETIRSPSDDTIRKASTCDTETGRSSFSSTRKLGTLPQQPNQARFARRSDNNQTGTEAWPYPAASTKGSEPKTNYTTTIVAGPTDRAGGPLPLPLDEEHSRHQFGAKKRNATMQANTAAWGYAKVAMLMFIALFIVWVPSTVNRVYLLILPEKPNFVLAFFAGLVLPLQGFWNAMVYTATSWSQCKVAFQRLHQMYQNRSFSPNASGLSTRMANLHNHHHTPSYYRHQNLGADTPADLDDPDFLSAAIKESTMANHLEPKYFPSPTTESDPGLPSRPESTTELTDCNVRK